MKRQRYVWPLFALCVALLLAGMGWVSYTALSLERAQQQAIRQAEVQQRIRLALWRMDSALLPLIIEETARPYYAYRSFHPVERAYTRMYAEIAPDAVIQPSQLLRHHSEQIVLHFQVSPRGEISSPQAPQGNERDLAESRSYLAHEEVVRAAARLDRLRKILDAQTLRGRLPAASDPEPVGPIVLMNGNEWAQTDGDNNAPAQERSRQKALSQAEYYFRSQQANQALQQRPAKGAPPPERTRVQEGQFRRVWIGEALLLARRVRIDDEEYVQGCWIDWPHVREWLLGHVRDLLPAAGLSARRNGGDGGGREMATVPVVLEPGPVPHEARAPGGAVCAALALAWACVLGGAAVVGVVLAQAVRLSRRRGAFVSAVTHEMRTPLTTFRLYSDMLADGMVDDTQKRSRYLQRLREEADRLSHLVENVLAYARLTGPRKAARLESVRLEAFLDSVEDRLAARAARGELALSVEPSPEAAAARVRLDPGAVEQILLNLVDNACKYAGRAGDRRLHVEADRDDGVVRLAVRDHGPGIADSYRTKLFRPFGKSAGEAAQSAPGIGLGLALSRRLARNMGGDLRLDEACHEGARFVLQLQVSSK